MAFVAVMGMLFALGLVALIWMKYEDWHNPTDIQAV